MIDVSQSVEPEHPMSLDFLRMDIKNVNLYFEKMGIEIFQEKAIFQFVITDTLDKFDGDMNSYEDLRKYVATNIPIKRTQEDEAEDEVFRSLHLVRNLEGLEERDFDRFTDGKFDLLKSLLAQDNKKNYIAAQASKINVDSSDENISDSDDEGSDEGSDDDTDGSDEEEQYSEAESYEEVPKELKGKKYEDKDLKKQRKQEAKEAKREKRKTKVKKHIKKKLVNKTKSKK